MGIRLCSAKIQSGMTQPLLPGHIRCIGQLTGPGSFAAERDLTYIRSGRGHLVAYWIVASSCKLLSSEGVNSYEFGLHCPILAVDDIRPTH